MPSENSPGSNWLALVICGGAVGWVAGLSTSPVVQTILASAMAATVTLGTVLSGLRSNETDVSGEAPREGDRAQDAKSEKPPEETPKPRKRRGLRQSVQPWPLACALLGVALGATLGAKARTNEWLVPDGCPLIPGNTASCTSPGRSVFGSLSFSEWDDALKNGGCTSDPTKCSNPDKGKPNKERAELYGNISTTTFTIGGVALAGAALLWFLPSTPPPRTGMRFVPMAGLGGGGFAVHGVF